MSNNTIRYIPAIPEPSESPVDLLAAVTALKAAVEYLSGQTGGGGGRVLTTDDVLTNNPTYQRIADRFADTGDAAIDRAAAVLAATVEELRASVTDAQNDLQEALENGAGSWDDADQQLIVSINAQAVLNAANSAAITTESATRTTEVDALAGRIDTVETISGNNAAAITNEALARTSADTALASNITTVTAVAGRQRIFVQSTQPASPGPGQDAMWIDTAHANQIKSWNGASWVIVDNTAIAGNVAAITNEATARADADSSLATQINSVLSVANGAVASVTSEATTRASADSAIAGSINTVTAIANDGTASSMVRQIAVAADAQFNSAYQIQCRINSSFGYANAGLTLGANLNGGYAVFDVDRFLVRSSPSALSYPFQIIGGNTYISDAFIENASITNAKIANLTVGTTKITGNAVTESSISFDTAPAAGVGGFNGLLGGTLTVTLEAGYQYYAIVNAWFDWTTGSNGVINGYLYVNGTPVETYNNVTPFIFSYALALTANGAAQTTTAQLVWYTNFASPSGYVAHTKFLSITVVKR